MSKLNVIYLRNILIGTLSVLLFFVFAPTSYAATIVLDEPFQDCQNVTRAVSLSWTSDISGNPTYYILRKLDGEINYSEIGNTQALVYVDNTALSDKNYSYRIKSVMGGDIFSNIISAAANYCPTVFQAMEVSCKTDGPHSNLAWIGATGNVLKYEIIRKNDTAGETEFIKIGETTSQSYDDGPNIVGTDSYSYSIRTVWQNGIKKDSASVSVEATACPVILNADKSCLGNSPGGQKINLSWNSLMGVARYEVYRKAQSEAGYSLLSNIDPISTAYVDQLVESLPFSYWQSGNINYFVKAVWLKDAEEITKDSSSKQITNFHCSPFVSTSGMCDSSGNPEMHLNWTKTMNADFYNIFRNSATFLGQYGSATNSFIDYLSPADCSNPSLGMCTHEYKVVSGVTGYSNFTSNIASQSVDCATIVPPSPTPVLNVPEMFCDSGDSRIRLSWTSSENVIYYTLYRNGMSLLNLTNTTYIDSGVEAGSEYTYYVIANGREGTQTLPSLTQTANAPSCVPPTLPVLSLSNSCLMGNPKINLSWSSTSDTVNYEIKRGLSEAGIATKAVVNNNTYSWSDTDSLNLSTTYYYQVIANGVSGSNPGYSQVLSIATYSCLPTLPVVTLAKTCFGGNPRVTVSWTSDNINTQNYKIYREDIGSPVATIPVGGTYSIADPNPLLIYTTYKYKVVAGGYNPGQETPSGYLPITTSNCLIPGPFALADPPTAVCQGAYPKIKLNWTSSANATSYNLFRSMSSPVTINGVTSAYDDVGLGNTLNFDGSNDYVTSGSPANLDMTTNDFTIEVWAKANGGTYGRGIVNKGGWSSNGFYISEAYSPNNRYYFGVKDSVGYKTVILPLYETWGWTHIVGIKKANHLEAWVNGSYVGQYNGTIGSLTNPTKAFEIGRSFNPYYFNGSIGEVRVYRRALSASEVVEHKNGIYTNETDLAGLWYLDEGEGQIVSDSSNYGKNATLGSAAGADSNDPIWGNNILTKTNYSWKIDAVSLGGSASSNMTAPFLTPECSPQRSNLVLSPLCISNKAVVDILWPYSIDAETYEIYRNGVLIKTAGQSTDPNLRKWTDDNAGTGLSDSTNYAYYIRSINSSGANSQSADRIITTGYCAVLPPVAGLSAAFSCTGTPASAPKAALSWNAVPGATSYDIYRNGLFLINKTILAHEDTTITVNTLYDYTVRAKNAGGESSDSNIASIGLGQYCVPQQPIINLLAGCSNGNPSNNISWSSETYPNTIIYKIYRGTVNDFTDAGTVLVGMIDKATQPAAFAARTFIDNPSTPRLLDEATYYYWVQAIGPAPTNYSTLSSGKNVLNLFCGPPQSTDTLAVQFLCGGTPPSNPYAGLTWDAIVHATSYDIYRNGVFLANKTTLTHNDSTINVNTAYNYTVRGKNANGQGTDSNVASIALGNYCTPSVPAISPVVTACESNKSKNTISWTNATPNNTNNFEIYRSIDNVTISNFENATFTPPGWLTGGNANWFRDAAVSSEGIASAASGAIGHGQSTFFDYDITVSNSSALRFYWKVSSENNYDFLLFCLDNDGCTRSSGYRSRISGTSVSSFVEVVVPLSAGSHSLRWVYAKDGSVVSGSDKGWIDNVRIASIDSAILLQTLDKNKLTWADSDGLVPLSDYLYWVKTVGPTGLSSFSARGIKTLSCEIMPPIASLNVSFSCTGANPHAELAWDNVPNATSYNIYRNGTYLTSRTTNSYDDLGISINTAYSYIVRADNDSGEGADSNVASIGLGNYCIPFEPVIDPINSICSSEKPANVISWSDDFPSGTKKYEIYRNTVGDFVPASLMKTLDKTDPADLLEFNSRTWTDNSTSLLDLETYYYWIKSVGPTDLSAISGPRSIQTLFCGVPGVPALSLGSAYCDTNVPYADLSWTASTNAYSYDLFRNNISDSIQSDYPTVISPMTDSGSKALQLDGTDDYAGTSASLLNDQGKFFIGGWIKPANGGTKLGFFGQNDLIEFGFSSGSTVQIWTAGGGSVSTAYPYPYGEWHYVAATGDGSAGGLKIFFDGNITPAVSGGYATANYGSSAYKFNIGGGGIWDASGNYFNGSIDEVRVYHKSLSGAEIANMYSGVYDNESGLVGSWHFDERSGINAIDSSGMNNNGMLYNGIERQNSSLPATSDSVPLESNKNYKYAMKALGVGTESALSNEISITAPDCMPIQADLNLTPGCDVSGTQMVLSWDPDPNTSYWTTYKKRTGQPDSAYTCINCPGTTLNSYIDLNIESNASYDYYVEAYGSSSTAISEVKTAIASVCFDIPNKPVIDTDYGYVCGDSMASTDNTVLPKCAGSASRMEINWNPYDDSKTFSYNIFRRNVSEGETDFTLIRENMPYLARNYFDGNVDNNKDYIYKIEAVGSGVDNSVESEPSLQITSCDCENMPPYNPPFLSIVSAVYTLGSGGNVEIKWDDTENESSYEVFRRLQGDSEFAYAGGGSKNSKLLDLFIDEALAAYLGPIGVMVANTDYEDPAPMDYVTFNDLTVGEDMTYEYQVRALNTAGITNSNIISPVYVPIAPPGDFILSRENNPNSVKLNWTAALYSVKGGVPRYTVYKDSTPDFASPEIICEVAEGDPRRCTDNNIFSGLSYYKVRAINNSPIFTESNIILSISSLKWDETAS